MEKWIAEHLISLIVFISTTVASFTVLKVSQKNTEKDVTKLTTKVDLIEDALIKHKDSTQPHKHCPVHSTELATVKEGLKLKMDREPCVKIHESIDRRLNDMGISLKDLTSTLAPLGTIQKTLERIERMVDHNKELIEDVSNHKQD
jgi:hypothetical protein